MPNNVKVTFLGGLGSIGRNCAAVEINNKIMLIDCGIMFPEADMAGVDIVLPNFEYLRDPQKEVVGVVCTHGHEDHIGAISSLLAEMPLKLIGSKLTLGLAKNRIGQNGLLGQATFVEVEDGQRIQIDEFDMEFFPVTHSVPNGFATAFHTPQGVVLHSGDFKLDMTPVDGRHTDLSGLGRLANVEGVRLLLCDSTNADSEGYSDSETSIGASLAGIFRARQGQRIVVACFASHIHRIQQVADAAIATGRSIVTLGRSMNHNIALARELGLLHIPENRLMNVDDLDNIPDGDLCVICTGSQGEPMAALSRMARGDSQWLNVRDNDCIIFSSHPIPGNETSVTRVIDNLIRKGAEVVHSGNSHVHSTGHAKSLELRVFHSVVKPENFVPVHGEYAHMSAHAKLAEGMGLNPDNILICGDGNSVELTEQGLRRADDVPGDYVYISGSVGEVGASVLNERNTLGQDGFVSVIVPLLDRDGELVLAGEPRLISRGWVSEELTAELHKGLAGVVAKAVEKALAGSGDALAVEKAARRAAGKYINAETRLRPMVVPVTLGVSSK